MLEHKARLAEKRKAAKALKDAQTVPQKESSTKKQKITSTHTPQPAVKKPKISGGLSRSKLTNSLITHTLKHPP